MGVSLPDRTLIKQPVNQDLRVENGVLQLTERFKGRYTWCQGVAKDMYALSALNYAWFQSKAGTLSAEYATPQPPDNYAWWFAQATVDECDAGENGFLQLIWNAQPADQYDGNFDDWPVVETWNLQWQPENYDVYAYCANPAQHVDAAPLASQRVAVEQCLHPPIGNNVMTMNSLFMQNNGLVMKLNENEQKILKWKLEGKHVIKHHPLVTQQKTWSNIPKSQLQMILNGATQDLHNPDVLDPNFSPGFLQGFVWVSQGSNLQTTQPDIKQNKFSLTVTNTWVGAESIVDEFYSNDPSKRWEFGTK